MELVISLLTALIGFALSLFVYVKNTRSGTNFYFAALFFFIGLYPIFNYLSLHAGTSEEAFMWAKLILLCAIPSGPLFYFFVKTFPSSQFIFNKKLQIGITVWVIINIFLALEGLIFESVTIVNGSPVIKPGPAVVSFGLLQISSILIGSITLVEKYKHATGILKQQLRYILLGILLGFGLTIFSTIVLPIVFNNTMLLSISPLYLLLVGVSIAYSIIRHRLLDIRFIVARSVAYTLLLTIIGSFYAVDVFIISNYLFQSSMNMTQIFTYVVLALFIAFTFQPLKDALEEGTEKVFFKNNYHSSELVLTLTKIMASTIRLEDVTQKTLKELLSTVHISHGTFIIFNKETDFSLIHDGYTQKPHFDKETISELYKKRRVLIYDEEQDEHIKQLMQENNISFAVPLYNHNQGEGILVLGEKKSGEIYSEQDIDLLTIFGSEISVAIRNAKSYEEISKFNITLREEIAKATKDVNEANERLKELDKLKDEFVSVASHELRTPMTAIKSYLWMALRGKGGPLTEKQKFYLERSYTSVDRLIKLVNDMLNISRIESGRISVKLQEVNLPKLVGEVMDEVMPRADELGVSVKLDASPSLAHVMADSDKIKEVLFNLIGNSLKFTPKGGKIIISFSQKDAMVETRVTDTGVGIPAEEMPKLFQKFGLLPGSYTVNRTASGTGLGLYISHSIIDLHKGKMWAKSEGRDKGSEFGFSLKEFNKKDLPVQTKEEDLGIIHTKI